MSDGSLKYPIIKKIRRESFGGIIFNEKPAFLAYVDEKYANKYNIPKTKGAILVDNIFSAPIDAHFAITTRCNLFCHGCYNTNETDKPIDISFDKAKSVIDKLSELNVFSLSFGGGEPTLHPHIIDIAAYAREKHILPNMTTNGLTMTKEFANACIVFGNVHFSIHTAEDIDHIIPAMITYRKATGHKPSLNLLLSTETLPYLDEILLNAKKAGIKAVLFLRYKTTSKNVDTHDLSLDNIIGELPERLKKLQKNNKRVMFLFDCSLFEVLAESNYSSLKTYQKFDYNGCLGGNAVIAIDVNGMYKPCSFLNEPFGDVQDLTFYNWIYGKALNEFRTKNKDDACISCDYNKLCNGGCRLYHNDE
ncbi:MAG: radical SAM protein [Oscillospiraceae bacterium]|nr:radical SAM protein [Oscillospiraceae bacterium]